MDNEIITIVGGLITTIATSLGIITLGVKQGSKITSSFIESLNKKDNQFIAELKEIRDDREKDRNEREAYNANHLSALSALTATLENISQTINKNSDRRTIQLKTMEDNNEKSFNEILEEIRKLELALVAIQTLINTILELEKKQLDKMSEVKTDE